jgi:hypothetical protein
MPSNPIDTDPVAQPSDPSEPFIRRDDPSTDVITNDPGSADFNPQCRASLLPEEVGRKLVESRRVRRTASGQARSEDHAPANQAGEAMTAAASSRSAASSLRAADVALALGCKTRPDANGNYQCSCPSPLHRNGDKRPSLSVRDGHHGKLLLYCFSGCEYGSIVTALEARGLRR